MSHIIHNYFSDMSSKRRGSIGNFAQFTVKFRWFTILMFPIYMFPQAIYAQIRFFTNFTLKSFFAIHLEFFFLLARSSSQMCCKFIKFRIKINLTQFSNSTRIRKCFFSCIKIDVVSPVDPFCVCIDYPFF